MNLRKNKKNQTSQKIRFRRTKKLFLLSSIKKQHQFIRESISGIFRISQPTEELEYKDLKIRGINQQVESRIIKRLSFMIRLCLLLTALDYIYMLYLFIQGYWLAALLTASILLAIIAHAFKYHFWRYQLYKKKLGCSFKEWLKDLITFKGK